MAGAVIFDLDGVILNSEPLHFEADLRTMREYGMELTEETFTPYIGVTGPEMWADLIVKLGIPDTLQGVTARQMAIKRALLQETKLEAIPGIPALLLALQQAGAPVGLASSSPRYFIEAVLENLGLSQFFRVVVSGEEVARGKPAPDVFLRAAELLGVFPGGCTVIEDSGHGVRAAKSAGMRCVGYVNPTSGEQDLSAADMTVTAFVPEELLPLLL